MDPFDEFEFKPLTDGLGFHKKKNEIKNSSGSASPTSKSTYIKDQGLSLLEEEAVGGLRPPLPRKNNAPSKDPSINETPSPTAVDEILKTLQKNKRFEFENAKETLKNTKTADEYRPTTWNFSASFLDSMLVLAASLLCMIILLVITRVDLIGNLTNPASSSMLYISTVTLFLGVSFIYTFLNRACLGCTPGEWAFDQRIGRPADMKEVSYIFKVAARSFLVMATGFVFFPLLSLFMNKDVVGQLTGASLYRKV